MTAIMQKEFNELEQLEIDHSECIENPTNKEIAEDWGLWTSHIDTRGAPESFREWYEMSTEERIAVIVECFGVKDES